MKGVNFTNDDDIILLDCDGNKIFKLYKDFEEKYEEKERKKISEMETESHSEREKQKLREKEDIAKLSQGFPTEIQAQELGTGILRGKYKFIQLFYANSVGPEDVICGNGNIVIGENRGAIVVLDDSGNLIRKFPLQAFPGKSANLNVHSITQGTNGNVYICEMEQHNVSEYDLNGNLIRNFETHRPFGNAFNYMKNQLVFSNRQKYSLEFRGISDGCKDSILLESIQYPKKENGANDRNMDLYGFTFDGCGNSVLTNSRHKCLYIFNEKMEFVQELICSDDPLYVAISPSGLIATTSSSALHLYGPAE